MRNILILSAAAVTLGLGTAALAGDDHVGKTVNVPRDQWLPVEQVISKMTAQGYTVQEIEADDGLYELEVTKDGVRQEAHVHPATGEVLSMHRDDD